MLVQHLLVENPFAAGLIQACFDWKAFISFPSNSQDPDGKLMFGVQGVVEKILFCLCESPYPGQKMSKGNP